MRTKRLIRKMSILAPGTVEVLTGDDIAVKLFERNQI